VVNDSPARTDQAAALVPVACCAFDNLCRSEARSRGRRQPELRVLPPHAECYSSSSSVPFGTKCHSSDVPAPCSIPMP
jgi:hypothetical protein